MCKSALNGSMYSKDKIFIENSEDPVLVLEKCPIQPVQHPPLIRPLDLSFVL